MAAAAEVSNDAVSGLEQLLGKIEEKKRGAAKAAGKAKAKSPAAAKTKAEPAAAAKTATTEPATAAKREKAKPTSTHAARESVGAVLPTRAVKRGCSASLDLSP